MSGCQKCGAAGLLLHAGDGKAYCVSCAGARDAICQRCSQYAPGQLMRPVGGMMLCVSCSQAVEKRQDLALQALSYPEACSRCGTAIEGLVHVWNDKPLCGKCLEEAKDSWEVVSGKPGKGGTKVRARKKKAKRKRKVRKKMKIAVSNPFRKIRPMVERRPMSLPRYLR